MKVTNFTYTEQPYGTQVITGDFTPYTQADIDALEAEYKAAKDAGRYDSLNSKRSHINMVKARLAKGGGLLNGVVVEGSQTSYLLGHRSTKNTAGRSVQIYVTTEELERGSATRVAM